MINISVIFDILNEHLLKQEEILQSLTNEGITLDTIKEKKLGYIDDKIDIVEEIFEKYNFDLKDYLYDENYSFIGELYDISLRNQKYLILPYTTFMGFEKYSISDIDVLKRILGIKKKNILQYKGRLVKRRNPTDWSGAKKIKRNYKTLQTILKELAEIPKDNQNEYHYDLFFVDDLDTPDPLMYADLYIDFDSKEDSLEKVRVEVLEASEQLQKNSIYHKIYFSGRRGFGILIPASVVGISSGIKKLNEIYYEMVKMLFSNFKYIDFQIYHTSHLVRAPNSIHFATNLRKIELKYEELKNLSIDEIKELAKEPRTLEEIQAEKNDFLFEIFRNCYDIVYNRELTYKDTFDEEKIILVETEFETGNIRHPPCIEYVLKNGVEEGSRNEIAYSLAIWFINNLNKQPEDIKDLLLSWNLLNKPPLPEREIISVIDSAVKNKKYLSCHSIIYNFCDKSKCYRFIRKDNLAKYISPELINKKFSTDAYIVGTGLNYYAVPSKVSVKCNNENCDKYTSCPFIYEKLQDFSNDTKFLYNLFRTNTRTQMVEKIAGKIINNCKFKIEDIILKEYGHVTLQELLLLPRNEVEGFNIVKEKDNIVPRLVSALYLAKKESDLFLRASSVANMTGVILKDDKDKKIRFIIEKINEIEKHQKIPLTEETIDELKDFIPEKDDYESISKKINQILDDISYNITKIYERNDLLFGILLTYHSPLEIIVRDRKVKGWLQFLVIGDAGTGKTKQFQMIQRATGLGGLVTGGTASRTGIAYTIYQAQNGMFTIQWGQMAQKHTELLCIDEVQFLKLEDIASIRSAREDGVIKIDRAVQTEAPAKVRLIVITNPPLQDKENRSKIMIQELYPVKYLTQLFAHPDIRRFDFAVSIMSTGEEKSIDMIKKHAIAQNEVPNVITASILRKSILLAWSLEPEDILLDEDFITYAYEKASEISKMFAGAIDIPLAGEYGEMKDKMIRLATSLAVLLKSHKKINNKIYIYPQKVHVDYIYNFLINQYKSTNFGYYAYAQISKKKNIIDVDEIYSIKEKLKEDNMLALLFIVLKNTETTKNFIPLNLIQVELGLEKRKDVMSLLNVFMKMGLIERSGTSVGGYIRTPKFNQFVNYLSDNMPDELDEIEMKAKGAIKNNEIE